MLVAFCYAPLVAAASVSNSGLVDLMNRLRQTEAEAQEKKFNGLYDSFEDIATSQEKKLVSLALGVHNLDSNSRLALQFLSSTELSCHDDDPVLPIARYYKSRAQLALHAPDDAIRTAEDLLKRGLGDAWDRQIYVVLIEAFEEVGDQDGLIAAFDGFSKRFTFNRRQEHLARIAVETLEKKGSTGQAVAVLEDLARGFPTSETSRWAFNRLMDYSCEKENKNPYRFSREFLIQLSRNTILDPGLKELLGAFVDQPLKLTASIIRPLDAAERIDYLFRARIYDKAEKEVDEQIAIERRHGATKDMASLMLERGRILMRLHKPEDAAQNFSQFLAMFPKHPQASRVTEYLGDALRYLGMSTAAASQYDLAQGARGSSHLLQWQRFWSTYRAKDYVQALKIMEKPGFASKRDGEEEEMANYWRAKIFERQGKKVEAKALFKVVLNSDADGYYGNLVAAQHPDWRGEPPLPLVAGLRDAPKVFSLAAKILFGGRDHSSAAAQPPELRLVDNLLNVGLRDAAQTQLSSLQWSKYSQDDAFAAVSRVAWLLDNYQASRKIRYTASSALKAAPKAWSSYVKHQRDHADEWKVYFPLAFESVVSSVAERVGIDRYFMLSIMRAESYYNQDARSAVGATGLMQLMPYTAIKIAGLVRDDTFDVRDLGVPEVNIGYGGYYLNKLLKYYGGNPFLAAAAYNGGPDNVDFWLKTCDGCDTDEFVEAIPFRETRRYVRQVMTNYSQYLRIYGGQQGLAALPELPKGTPTVRAEDGDIF